MSDGFSLRPRITVVGIGGAGCNAVNNMIRAQLEGVEFLVANTDAQSLDQSLVDFENRIQLGPNMTKGLGAGSKPDVGQAAAEESIPEVAPKLQGSNMVFITAGMGGGTGTGAAPVIARIARDAGILTVGVITKPFFFEGAHRSIAADRGIAELQKQVDTLIIIPNQNLFRVANEKTTFADAFKMADEVLYSGVRGVTDLMIMPGLINLDFADVKAVMAEMGNAMMGTGEAEGERRALDAAEAAISNPLLDDVSMRGAKGVLISITGGFDLTLFEVDEAVNRIREDVEGDANIIFGSTFDERLDGKIRVSVVATGIGQPKIEEEKKEEVAAPEMTGFNGLIRKTFGGGNQGFSAHNPIYSEAQYREPEEEAPKKEGNVFVSTQSPPAAIPEQLAFEEVIKSDPPQPEHNYLQENIRERAEIPPRKAKLSFLERLTGTRNVKYQPKGLRVVQQENQPGMDDDLRDLEIPAFLRKSKR
ncbi:MAG: cell division protein FtsZ [Holosporales bacterium]|jgi:cell division protein FtsZ|nr:cell division protein FtsZ [Holosporales bacterium]